jgi:HlyD family secretion protein
VLQVASSALFRDGRRWAVYRVVGGRALLTGVTPGMPGDGAIEIVAGLRQGDRVVAYPDDRMTDGARLRPLVASP